MKYKKLIKKLEDHYFGVNWDGTFLHIYADEECKMLVMNIDPYGGLEDCTMVDDMQLHFEAATYLFSNIDKFFKTPVEKREMPEAKENKYRIRLSHEDGDADKYLVAYTDTDNNLGFKTSVFSQEYTETEIKELKGKMFLDWDRVLERVE